MEQRNSRSILLRLYNPSIYWNYLNLIVWSHRCDDTHDRRVNPRTKDLEKANSYSCMRNRTKWKKERVRKKMDSQYLFHVTFVRGQTRLYKHTCQPSFCFVLEKLNALHKATFQNLQLNISELNNWRYRYVQEILIDPRGNWNTKSSLFS